MLLNFFAFSSLSAPVEPKATHARLTVIRYPLTVDHAAHGDESLKRLEIALLRFFKPFPMLDFIRRLERLEVRASKLFLPFIFYFPLNVKPLTHG